MDEELLNEQVEDTEVVDEVVDGVDEVDEITEETGEDTNTPTLYTQEQLESAIKTRVNTFNKKLDKMKPYEQVVKKISDITGLPINDLVNRLDGLSDIEQAKILGISPEQVAIRRQNLQTTKLAQEQAKKLHQDLEKQKLLSDPTYKDFTLFEEDINDLIEENPKLSLKQAYILVKGETATQAAVRDAEQRAIAKMTKSSNQRVIQPGQTSTRSNPKIDSATITAAKKVGMDPAEYAAFLNISNLDQFEKFNLNKKR